MIRWLTALASGRGDNCRLTLLNFHRVLPHRDPFEPDHPDARQFDKQISWLCAQFRVMPLLEACDRLFDGTLPPRCAAITFDDGYRDNHDLALPILRRHRAPATFFIATGFLDGRVMFHDRIQRVVRRTPRHHIDAQFMGLGSLPVASDQQRRFAIGRLVHATKYQPLAQREAWVSELEQRNDVRPARGDLMMRAEHLHAMLSAGMALGAHTRNHPILRLLDDDTARQEIEAGRDDLAALTGERPSLFAFPNGRHDDFRPQHASMLEAAGFRFAFTTDGGSASRQHSRWSLPRFAPWSEPEFKFKLRLLANLLAPTRPRPR